MLSRLALVLFFASVMTSTTLAGSILVASTTTNTSASNITSSVDYTATLTIPANTLSAGDILEIISVGHYSTSGGGAPAINFQYRMSEVAIPPVYSVKAFTGNQSCDVNATTLGFRHQANFVIRTAGSSGTMIPSQLLSMAIGFPFRSLTDTQETAVNTTNGIFVKGSVSASNSGGSSVTNVTSTQLWIVVHRP